LCITREEERSEGENELENAGRGAAFIDLRRGVYAMVM
jgi:hypothetical protein